MSAIFLEKAIWGFLALVGALIAVIYKLFNGSLTEKGKTQKFEIKEELTREFEKKFGDDIKSLKEELSSFKRHEDNNSQMQIKLLNKLLKKLDKTHPDVFDDLLD